MDLRRLLSSAASIARRFAAGIDAGSAIRHGRSVPRDHPARRCTGPV
ncbi:hypothetical protein [Nocardioides sp. SYSU DS0651]